MTLLCTSTGTPAQPFRAPVTSWCGSKKIVGAQTPLRLLHYSYPDEFRESSADISDSCESLRSIAVPAQDILYTLPHNLEVVWTLEFK